MSDVTASLVRRTFDFVSSEGGPERLVCEAEVGQAANLGVVVVTYSTFAGRHSHSSAAGSVWAVTARSQWPALRAKTNWKA